MNNLSVSSRATIRLSCQISIAEQWKSVIFRCLNTAHFIFIILKGHPRNTCQMFRTGQIKFAAFRLQNTVFQFCCGHLATQWHGPVADAKYSLGILCIWTHRSHGRCFYGVMSHINGGRWSPLLAVDIHRCVEMTKLQRRCLQRPIWTFV